MQPLIHFRQLQFIILRFILLYLLLAGWGIIEKGVYYLTLGLYAGATELLKLKVPQWVQAVAFIAANTPKVGYWLVLVFIGWPLFRDTSTILGVNLGDWIRLKTLKDLWARSDAGAGGDNIAKDQHQR